MADEIQSWDMTEVEDGGDRTLLPDGRYPFTVSKLIRTRAKDGAPMAEIHLCVDGGELGRTTVIENIKLVKSTDWKKSQLFKAIGAPVIDGKVQISWDALESGASDGSAYGVADFEVNEYTKDGKTLKNNKVSSFIPRGTGAPAQPARAF